MLFAIFNSAEILDQNPQQQKKTNSSSSLKNLLKNLLHGEHVH